MNGRRSAGMLVQGVGVMIWGRRELGTVVINGSGRRGMCMMWHLRGSRMAVSGNSSGR